MPAGLNRPTSDIEPIVGIQFGIFSPDEIERRSVVEITNAGTYDGNEPRIGGLFDPRMGVLDNGKTCRSCGQTNHSCPGHFGHFKLARPVYFIQFFPTILNVLNCVCVRCSKLLIDKTIHKEISRRRGEQRWRAVLNLCSSITRCGQEGEDGCGARQPERYVREGIARIVAEWDAIEGPGLGPGASSTKQRQYLEVEYVLRLFRRITDEDVDFLGLNRFWCRPDWMICSVMPIPPPQVRPSVIQDNNQRSEDDLTHKLFEIIMTNNRLQDKINNNLGKNLIEDEHTVLQYHVATLVDNQIPGVAPSAQRSGRPLKSVQQRLGSKEGRIRYNIQGKRVEFSARSVITPDPNISIAELGMPTKIAMNLTFPEKVTPYNITKMYKLIQNVGPNGEERHPGAKTIVRADGRMTSLKHVNRKEIVLHVGDVVNRHIMDGDVVLFNRQPTLHRMSMMGHRVKVLPYNTFRLNVSVTAPYNADFDGDEMNAHIPQSYESATELLEIAAVPHQIVTPRHAKPVIGIVQDTLVGSYRITRPHVNFNRREFMNMMMWNRRFEGVVPKGKHETDGKQRWTGQQIISQLLPPINMEMGNGLYKENKVKENFVRIREGEILEGIFDKDIFSKPSKGIIHTVFKDYGSTDTVNFIDSMQNTIEQFLVYNGFSVGVSDLIADEETRKNMEEVIKKRKVAIEDTLLQIHMDLFDNNTGKTNRQEFEDKVYGELNKATEEAGKIGLGSLSDENRLVAMVRAGSKGSTINIAQMMACVGQQAPEGRRIPYGFTDRTLPHYKKYDDGAEARGFVESSFIEGLTPQEFFFHAMSGREGLIDTAVKSVTGDTKIVVMEDGVTKCVAIGDWIDALLTASTSEVEYFPNEANLELLQLQAPVSIQTCDDVGIISNAAVTAVTRHDPGETLYEVTTQSGRSVIVTAAKSLIVYNEVTGLYMERRMADISVGDALPAINSNDAKVVVKDIITLIVPIDVRPGTPGYEKYPKMYDITVPSTLNFALENGLVVRDTADTGYIQRQLVKAMEDLTTQYDGTVRDSRMNILQFQYGEDGINATKIESANLGIGKLSEEEILKQYGMVGVDISGIMEEGVQRGEDTDALAEFAIQVVADRKMLVEGIQRLKQDAPLFASVNLERVLTNVAVSFQLSTDKKTDLTPLYIMAGIERVIQRTQTKHALWAALLRYYLSPHKLIVKERFTAKAFDTACEMILVKNWQSWVQPGEQVGIIAAQSIGEPSTQMSALSSTIIHVINVKTGKNFYGPISDFIDPLIGPTKPEVSSVLRTELDEYRIVGVSQDEKVSWMPISEVSRHPANGGLVKVTTKSGRSTTATLSHSFLHRTEKGVEAIKGSDLRVGTRVPIAAGIPDLGINITHPTFSLDHTFGWLCGIYLADGSFSGNSTKICKIHPVVEQTIRELAKVYDWGITTLNYCGEFGPGKDTIIYSKELKAFLLSNFSTGSYAKKISGDIFAMPKDFQRGLLSGYFDGDGNVNAEKQMIRAGSRSKELINGVNRLLSYCGFFGVLGEETSVRIPGKVMYTINVLKRHAKKFKEEIGLKLTEKAAGLDEIIKYMERENKHDTKELYDKIPACGNLIAEVGKELNMPGQSRMYGRWIKKESVGRLTLIQYIKDFKAATTPSTEKSTLSKIEALESAAYSDVVWDEITALEYLDDPKEFVYDFTVPGNDSFMVDDCILVHNTLNSVDWDTKIMIAKNGKIVCTDIGEFVDTHMATVAPESIQRFPNDQLYLDLKDGNDWCAISCDEDGQMMWTKLEAVTRHPVVNEDGTNTILEVTTDSGRVVKGTKGKSFLKLVDGKIVGVNGSELKVGDCLPIANSLALKGLELVESISVREHLPPTEWLYGTDATAALAALNGTDRHWFQKNNGTTFTIPYSRSDAFREAFVDGKNTNATAIRPGFVYPARTRPDVSQIPENIALTESFGFFVGAYLAEGSSNTTQVNVTNNDSVYLERVNTLMKEWNVGTHGGIPEQREATKSGIKGTTTSLVIHSTLLATLMQRLFGRVSHEKTLPDWVFQAPDEFVQGLVDGYISGDGAVEKKTGCVKATSVSKELLVRFGTLFARYGIFSTISERTPDIGVFDSVRTNYTIYVPVKYSAVFAKTFRLSIGYKQDILNKHFLENTRERKCRRDTTREVVWDPIKSIKEVVPIKNLVYDLTVEGTRNFMTHSGHLCRDTFHLAGVAAKSNVTRGVPRLKELLKVTHNPKAISLTVYLKPEFRGSKDKARQVAQDLELTLLKDITVKTAIYYDPSDAETVVEEDTDLIKFYKLFEREMEEGEETTWSGWLLRFEMDRDRMFRKNISMDDVAYVLRTRFGESLHLTYSDYNSNRLIMRMRLPEQMKNGLDDLTNLKKFQNRILNGIVFRGVPGIKSVTFREDKDMLELVDGAYKEVRQYVLDTDGSNYIQVMNHPYVDSTRLLSSHVHDIYEILGIEATRAVLLNEITTLFEEAGVNNRHLGLLCDVMTRGGRLMPSDRHGINKTDIGPLAKASFEETEKILLNAALFGELDPVTGVSANIMTGQVIRGGTGFFNVLLDEGAFMRLQEGLAPVEGYDDEEGELTEEQTEKALYEDENDMCSSAQLRMNVTIPNATNAAEEPDIEVMVV